MKWRIAGKEQVYRFKGAYDHEVELTLFPKQLEQAGHVVVLAIHNQQFLFTKHKTRGMEWPGGKVEKGESPLQASIRELMEETGAQASSMWLVGQYKVYEEEDQFFIKNIYITEVVDINKNLVSGVDTDGAVLLPMHIQPTQQGFSPLVTDGVFAHVRNNVIIQEESPLV